MIQWLKKLKKNLNKELLALKKKVEITDGLFPRLRSTGGQPARLYEFAKVHEKDTPLGAVLSLSLSLSLFSVVLMRN